MQYTMAGMVLFTEQYEACVRFYGQVLGLDVLHEIDRGDEQLTTFSLGGTYLMVEGGGVASAEVKTVGSCPSKFRFNVSDVRESAEVLRARGVEVTVIEHSWGTTAEFADPDGNPCALRSDQGFGQ